MIATLVFAASILAISALTAYLLRSVFVSRLFLSTFVAHNALVRPATRRSQHSRLPAMFAALVQLAF
jgi:hypothetical protein